MTIQRPQQPQDEEEPQTADAFNKARLSSVDAFNARRIRSNLNGGSYAAGLVVPREKPKKKSAIIPAIVTTFLFAIVVVFALGAGVVIGLIKLPPDLMAYVPPQIMVLVPTPSAGGLVLGPTATPQALLPGETAIPTTTPTPVYTPTPLITLTPTITLVPTLDLSKPTVLCNDGAKLSVEYSRGACNFHDGLKELLQPIPELKTK